MAVGSRIPKPTGFGPWRLSITLYPLLNQPIASYQTSRRMSGSWLMRMIANCIKLCEDYLGMAILAKWQCSKYLLAYICPKEKNTY